MTRALLALILLAAPAVAREAEAPAPVREQPGLPLMCQIVRPPAHGEPDARLPVCAVPWADDARKGDTHEQ